MVKNPNKNARKPKKMKFAVVTKFFELLPKPQDESYVTKVKTFFGLKAQAVTYALGKIRSYYNDMNAKGSCFNVDGIVDSAKWDLMHDSRFLDHNSRDGRVYAIKTLKA